MSDTEFDEGERIDPAEAAAAVAGSPGGDLEDAAEMAAAAEAAAEAAADNEPQGEPPAEPVVERQTVIVVSPSPEPEAAAVTAEGGAGYQSVMRALEPEFVEMPPGPHGGAEVFKLLDEAREQRAEHAHGGGALAANADFIALDESDGSSDERGPESKSDEAEEGEIEDDEAELTPEQAAMLKEQMAGKKMGKKKRRKLLSKITAALGLDGRGTKRKRDDDEPDVLEVAPWIRSKDYFRETEVAMWLHREIKDFVRYVSPTPDVISARAAVVDRVQKRVGRLWADARVHVFGSFATDLYLPEADIDLVVISEAGQYTNRKNLYELANALKHAHITDYVDVIAKARVPIIKFVDKTTGINVDVSFEKYGGVVAAHTIQTWLRETPGLRELTLVVKSFLAKRELNNVATGGLGGFAVTCMVLSFLQVHPKVASGEIDARDNLGVLLIEFFELYGKNFNYEVVGIDVDGACYFHKDSDEHAQNRRRFSLAIRDPNDVTNNISRGTHNLRNIKRAFGGAFDMLTGQCFELDTMSYKRRKGKSLLGSILHIRED
ncbi:uncharacterized protein V1510DRAFT_419501 [Dipodascopsis tothii]|uniref:uncharacterized protein n=1 Tax=Dipodascopsis tothii TaxID=44089 RepID=UPI0034CD03B5